jgi:hypothetical protein
LAVLKTPFALPFICEGCHAKEGFDGWQMANESGELVNRSLQLFTPLTASR